MKWKFFIDEKGEKAKCGLINGSQLRHELIGVYFELAINPKGDLIIDIDEDHYYFYKGKKLKKIYQEIYDLCVDLSNRKSFTFYSEITFKNSRLIRGVSSKIKNRYY